jgi:hypothetical protein
MQNVDELLKRLRARTRRQWVGSVQGMEDFADEDCNNAAALLLEQQFTIRAQQAEIERLKGEQKQYYGHEERP